MDKYLSIADPAGLKLLDKLLDELAMFMFENKQDLSSLKGSKILVKTAKNGLEFSFEND